MDCKERCQVQFWFETHWLHITLLWGNKMLKKVYNITVLFAFLILSCLVVLLCFSKTSTLTNLTEPFSAAHGKDTFLRNIKQRVDGFWKVKSEAPEATESSTEASTAAIRRPAPVNVTLGPCPETPPNLVGPLRVDFDYKRTLDEVRKEVGSPLGVGGRYKPPDCISKHKVGKWIKRKIYSFIHLLQFYSKRGCGLSWSLSKMTLCEGKDTPLRGHQF